MPFFEGHPTWTEVFNYMTLPDAVPHSDSASGEKVAGKKLKNVSSCAYYRVQNPWDPCMEYLPYIFPCSCGHSSPHVGKYTIHGSYGKVPYYWHGKKTC